MIILAYIAAGFLPQVAEVIADVSGSDALLIDLLIMFVAISLIARSKHSRESIKKAAGLPAKAKPTKKTDGY